MLSGLSFHSWLKLFAGVAAVTAAVLLLTVGAVVIPQQSELSRRQEEALRNHEMLRKNQLEIIQRISSLEGRDKLIEAMAPTLRQHKH